MEEFGRAREVEERIQHALEGVDDGKFKTLRDAADKHHVPYTRIYARYHDRPSKIGRPGTKKRLNPEQEAALRLYIRRCDEIGYSALPHIVYDAATTILKESCLDPTIPFRPLGRDWVLELNNLRFIGVTQLNSFLSKNPIFSYQPGPLQPIEIRPTFFTFLAAAFAAFSASCSTRWLIASREFSAVICCTTFWFDFCCSLRACVAEWIACKSSSAISRKCAFT
jgi:hypothetical protein